MTRAIGIDIGSRSIKIAEVEVNQNERSVVGLTEIPYSDPASIGSHLKDFFSAGSTPGERIAVGVGATPVVVKYLEYPFGDKMRAGSAIRADFEDSLPFEITDQILDFKLIARRGRTHQFLAGLCPQESIQNLNTIFENAGISSHSYLLDTETLGQLALDQCLPAGRNPVPYVVCDFGYNTTKITILQGTRPQTFNRKAKADPFGAEILEMRVINRGSRDLIEWIQDRRKLSASEAEQWLIHRAEIKESTHEGDASISDDMSDDIKVALRPVVVEIYQTIQSFRGKMGRNLATLYVTGGMTKLRGVREFLSHELRLPVNPWPTLVGFRTEGIPISADQERSFAAALSLAHRYSSPKPVGWLNFKRSSQANKKILTGLLAHIKDTAFRPAFVGMAVALACVYAYFITDGLLLNKQQNFLQSELVTEFRRLNRDLGKRAEKFAQDPVRSREIFEQEKKKLGQSQRKSDLARARSDVLLDISDALPVDATLKTITVTDASSSLRVESKLEVANPKVVTPAWQENIKNMLQSKGYSSVALSTDKNSKALLLKAVWKGNAQ